MELALMREFIIMGVLDLILEVKLLEVDAFLGGVFVSVIVSGCEDWGGDRWSEGRGGMDGG